MESYRLIRRLFAATLLATAGSLVAAEAPSASAAKEAAKTGAADARKNAQEQINAERAKMIADHEALAKQYAAANEEQKKEILAKMCQILILLRMV